MFFFTIYSVLIPSLLGLDQGNNYNDVRYRWTVIKILL